MRFVFTRLFFILLGLGLLPLSLSWNVPALRYGVLVFDVLLIFSAIVDYFLSRNQIDNFTIERHFSGKFALADPTDVRLVVVNENNTDVTLTLKDEYPDELSLESTRKETFTVPSRSSAEFAYTLTPHHRGRFEFGRTALRVRSRLGLVWCQSELGDGQHIKVFPNICRAREIELRALGATSFLSLQRRSVRRGEGREFESMRDYVRGDELRHISWTATARRSKLTTRQYQVERDQTIVIALDAGRLMTGRIGDETKFDTALLASLALMSASSRSGDNCGLVVFGRRVRKYLPPKRGVEHMDAVLEALYDLEPELIEPSYARAFQFIAANTKKRAFVVVLTDLVDKDSSKELISSLQLLRPRHLPLVATIGDRDLNEAVGTPPSDIRQVFTQSAAEEIIHQREAALKLVEATGGLALDVTTRTLAPKLLEAYLRVKERGLL